jgi:hypothetical protein
MDAQIGRLFEGLHRTGLYDRSLIIAVSDHGEFLGENGLWGHSYRLDPELTHVPLLIKWPGQRSSQQVSDLLTSHVDLYATVAGAVGVTVPASDGLDLSPQSTRRARDRALVFLEEHASRIHQLRGPSRLSDHLFGLQRPSRRETIFEQHIQCQTRIDEDWTTVPCTVTWEDARALLTDRMRTVAGMDAAFSLSDLDAREREQLEALGYLD